MNIDFIFLIWSLLLFIPILLYGYKKYRSENELNLIEPLYLFGFIYWLSYGVNFFAVSHGIGIFGWATKYLSYSLEMEVLGISLIFFYLFVMGYSFASKFDIAKSRQDFLKYDNFEKITTATLLSFLTLTVYKIYFLYTAANHFGSIALFRSHFVEYSTGNGIATLFSSSFIEYFVVFSIALLFTTKKKFYIFALIFLIAINAFIFYYFQTSRRVILYCIIGAAFYLYEHKKIDNKKLFAIGILTILFVMLFLHFRALLFPPIPQSAHEILSQPGVLSQPGMPSAPPLYYFLGLLTVSFDMFIHSIAVFAQFPVQKYWNGVVTPLSFFYDQIISFIPRSIYTEKPLIYGNFYLQNLVYPEIYAKEGLNAGRFPLGIISTSYLYFGVFGIALVAIFTGVFYKVIYEQKYKNNIFLFIFLYFYITIFNVIRGGLDSIITQGIQLSFFLLLLVLSDLLYIQIKKILYRK